MSVRSLFSPDCRFQPAPEQVRYADRSDPLFFFKKRTELAFSYNDVVQPYVMSGESRSDRLQSAGIRVFAGASFDIHLAYQCLAANICVSSDPVRR
jgi:hypothetical protein